MTPADTDISIVCYRLPQIGHRRPSRPCHARERRACGVISQTCLCCVLLSNLAPKVELRRLRGTGTRYSQSFIFVPIVLQHPLPF